MECAIESKKQGLQPGNSDSSLKFVGDHSTKGCFAYKSGEYEGVALFGTGGSVSNMISELSGNIYRIQKQCVAAGKDNCFYIITVILDTFYP